MSSNTAMKILVGVLATLTLIAFMGWASAADRRVADADPAVGDYSFGAPTWEDEFVPPPADGRAYGPSPMNYPTARSAERAFIKTYEWYHDPITTSTEQFLIEEATLACTRLGNGYDLPDVWDVGVRDGMSSDQAATVIDLAIEIYCPRYHYLQGERGM